MRKACYLAASLQFSAPFFSLLPAPVEFKGHMLLAAVEKGDLGKMKKLISTSLTSFQHPHSLDSPLVG